MYKLNLFLFTFFVSFQLLPQQATNWENHTDMKEVSATAISENGIWAATSGGSFFYNLTTGIFETLHKTDGLTGSSLSAVTIDKEGKVWFGSLSGIIDVYNPFDKSIKTILDIFNSDKSSKQINSMTTAGDTIIVSTDFGISLIDSRDYFFYDTYFKFGDIASNSKVNFANRIDLVYACTNFGLAQQKPGATNLSAPESWNVYDTFSGLPSNTVYKVVSFGNILVAATSQGLASFNGTSWDEFIPEFNGKNVIDVFSLNDSLFILSDNEISLYHSGTVELISSFSVDLSRVSYSSISGIFAASDEGIVLNDPVSGTNFIFPDGPPRNQFPQMTVDGFGNLWSASGKDGTGVGFYKYDGSTWANYDIEQFPELGSNDYYRIYSSDDNTIYAGNWGKGFTAIKQDEGKLFHFDASNTDINGVDENPNFIVIGGFDNDSKGNLWILNYGASDRKTLAMLTPDSTWHFFTIDAAANLYIEQQFGLQIDNFDTKWYYSNDLVRSGLFYFNENNTYDDPSDDVSGLLTSVDGLNDNSISALAVDRRGDVWVGTSLGVNIISNNGSVLTYGSTQLRITSVFSLRQQTINAIAVDPLNQKWIGTNQGLLLVNSDGTSLLAAYDTKNSPLLSDEIRSLAIDENSGRVYVGTDAGLISFETPAIKPQDSFTELFMYPNPYVLKDGSQTLAIDGLIRNSEIKVLTVTGKLVKEFTSPGGRIAFWDGRNEEGDLVSSGIYLIVAFDEEGNSITTGKVAVLRK